MQEAIDKLNATFGNTTAILERKQANVTAYMSHGNFIQAMREMRDVIAADTMNRVHAESVSAVQSAYPEEVARYARNQAVSYNRRVWDISDPGELIHRATLAEAWAKVAEALA